MSKECPLFLIRISKNRKMKRVIRKLENQIWFIAFISLFFLFQSCEKPGCTNRRAMNFDSDATEDDGSCIIEGCTDSDAINYDYEANRDDGSCIYPDGEAVFWTDDNYGHGDISIYLENSYVGKITVFYNGNEPTCGATGCVTITKSPGTYSFYATADDGGYWENTINIYSNGCSKMNLTGKKIGNKNYTKKNITFNMPFIKYE